MGRRIGLLLILLVPYVSMLACLKVASSSTATLYVTPSISYASPSESFTVDVKVADVELLYSWQVNMSWNPDVLSFVNVTEGDFLKGQPNGTWTVPPSIGDGWVLFSWMTSGSYSGVSGSGWLATVELEVTAKGESILAINNTLTKLVRYNPPPVPPGGHITEPIPHTRENGFFTNIEVPPHAEFTYSPSLVGINQEITFNASASYAAHEILSYEWDFGDGTNATYIKDVNLTTTTTHTYTEGGNYTVTLTVIDDAPATTLVQATFNTSRMPRIWYDRYGTVSDYVLARHGHDIAITEVRAYPSEVAAGEPVYINVTVLNKGSETEDFNVIAYYDDTAIETKPVAGLAAGSDEKLVFTWDTAGVAEGTYTIHANATGVEGEESLGDNARADGTVMITGGGSQFPVILVAAAVIAIVAVLGVFLYLRRRRGAPAA